jgi:hypothetical protein
MPDNPSIPAVPDTSLPEKKRGRPVGATSKKSKADNMEDKAYGFIMEMFANYEELKKDATFQERLTKDPYLASTLIKDLSQLAKRILDITVAKLRIEELKSQKATEAGGDGAKNVFIIQGLYDSNAPKTIEVTTDDGPVKFQTKGLEA